MVGNGKSLVMCVDDESIVLESLVIQLRKNFKDKFEIETSTEPEEALEIIKESIEEGYEIPLVISDYTMPGMKGDSFLKEVHRLNSRTHKVLLTGQATIEGVANTINHANLFRYLSKPWDELDLTLTIDKAIESYNSEIKIRELLIKNEDLYKKMKESFVSSITALSDAIDARDKYTIGHSHRVTKYALMMGKEIGFNEDKLENLEYMGVLHDIGKIGIPDQILLKENKLTPGEFDNMKNHVTIGADILKNIARHEELLPGVLYHHERYDGKGYKNMKKGEDIPLEARIICVADAFDAMTSDRPYRKGMPKKDAIKELIDHSGTQFDPKLVTTFCQLVSNMEISN